LWRQSADWAAIAIYQSSLTRQRIAILLNCDQITTSLPNTSGGDRIYIGIVSINIRDIFAHSLCRLRSIKFDFEYHSTCRYMKLASESQDCRYFGLSAARFSDGDSTQLILNISGHCHTAI
jgi:hypothetical protein